MWFVKLFGKNNVHNQAFIDRSMARAYYDALKLEDEESKELVDARGDREIIVDIELELYIESI